MGVLTLTQIRAEAAPHRFPRHVLEGCESALVVFAAAFLGRQDAVWMADAGLTATCVDTSHERLGQMVLTYPEGWEYVHSDAYTYAEQTTRSWDVVSLDPPSDQFQSTADRLPLWCSLANRVVILGTGIGTEVDPPSGWKVTETLQRSGFLGGVFWQVIRPC